MTVTDATPDPVASPESDDLTDPEPDNAAAEASASDEDEHGGDVRDKERPRFLIALLIAVIAATAAVATWRAGEAGTQAESATEQGVALQILATGDRLADRTKALDLEQQTSQVADLQNADHVARDVAGSPATNRNFGPDSPDQSTASETSPSMQGLAPTSALANAVAAEYVGEWSLRNAWLNTRYISSDSSLYLFNVAEATNDLVAENAGSTADAGPPGAITSSFSQAETDESRRMHLLYVDLGLVLALALAAIAQLVRRHRSYLTFGATSAALFVAGAVALIWLEVA